MILYQPLDQVDGDHETHTLTYDNRTPDKSCARVREGERGVGRGYSPFIAHSELEPKYLRNDTLLFQIHKVKLEE